MRRSPLGLHAVLEACLRPVARAAVLVGSCLVVAGCAGGAPWRGAAGRAARALDGRSPADYGGPLAELYARFNLPVTPPADLVERVARHAERVAAALGASPGVPASPAVRVLALGHAAERVSAAVAEAHLPAPLPAAAEAALAVEHAAAALHALAAGHPGLRARLAEAARVVSALPEVVRAQLPTSARESALRLGRPGPVPFEVLLARSFPQAFDREGVRALTAYPRARICTLRTVEAPMGSLATVTAAGHLLLATPRALREVPPSGVERRRRLPAPLRPGLLLAAGPWLAHLAPFGDRLEASVLSMGTAEAAVAGVVVVRGASFLAAGGLLPTAATPGKGPPAALASAGKASPVRPPSPPSAPPILAVRRVAPGYEELVVDLAARRARRLGGLPGATGHRDGPLGEARFVPGPFTTLSSGARVFFDPAARALRVAERGFVGTVFAGPERRDGVGEQGRVGRVLGLATDAAGRVYLAEEGRPEGGFLRFHLRLVRWDGQACP